MLNVLQRGTKPHRCQRSTAPKQQQGAVVLFVVVVLAVIMAIIALSVSKPVLVEQKMAGNDIRAKEALEAAEAGLAFAKAWTDSSAVTTNMSCPGGSGCPVLPSITGTTSGETYTLSVDFAVDADGNIQITSSAANSDNTRAQVEDWVAQVSMLNDPTFPPPIVVNGSMSGVTGNPVIDTGTPPDPAILYNSNVASAGSIETGKYNKKGSDPELGSVVGETFPTTATPAWDHVFSVSLSSAIAQAQTAGYLASAGLPSQPSAGSGSFFLWDSSSHIHASYGTATNPVVIIIPNECPKINGGPVIYGIVYFGNSACSNKHGWGNATIYGSVVVEGDITKVTANADIIDWNSGGTTAPNVFLDYSTTIPGTWKDF